jgi:hypothetical protein
MLPVRRIRAHDPFFGLPACTPGSARQRLLHFALGSEIGVSQDLRRKRHHGMVDT